MNAVVVLLLMDEQKVFNEGILDCNGDTGGNCAIKSSDIVPILKRSQLFQFLNDY